MMRILAIILDTIAKIKTQKTIFALNVTVKIRDSEGGAAPCLYHTCCLRMWGKPGVRSRLLVPSTILVT